MAAVSPPPLARSHTRDSGRSERTSFGDRYRPGYSQERSPEFLRRRDSDIDLLRRTSISRDTKIRNEGMAADFDYSKVPKGPKGGRRGLEPVPDTARRVPHIFISREGVPVLGSTIGHLTKRLKRYQPFDVKIDDSGYYVLFPDTISGRTALQECYRQFNMQKLWDYTMLMTPFKDGLPPTESPFARRVRQATPTSPQPAARREASMVPSVPSVPSAGQESSDYEPLELDDPARSSPAVETLSNETRDELVKFTAPVAPQALTPNNENPERPTKRQKLGSTVSTEAIPQTKTRTAEVPESPSGLDVTHDDMMLDASEVLQALQATDRGQPVKSIERDLATPVKNHASNCSQCGKRILAGVSPAADIQALCLKCRRPSIAEEPRRSSAYSIPETPDPNTFAGASTINGVDHDEPEVVEDGPSALPKPQPSTPSKPSEPSASMSTPGSSSKRSVRSSRPNYTNSELAGMALLDAPGHRLPANEICKWIADHIPGYDFADKTSKWQSHISATLSAGSKGNRPLFEKQDRREDDPAGKGNFWALRRGEEHRIKPYSSSKPDAEAATNSERSVTSKKFRNQIIKLLEAHRPEYESFTDEDLEMIKAVLPIEHVEFEPSRSRFNTEWPGIHEFISWCQNDGHFRIEDAIDSFSDVKPVSIQHMISMHHIFYELLLLNLYEYKELPAGTLGNDLRDFRELGKRWQDFHLDQAKRRNEAIQLHQAKQLNQVKQQKEILTILWEATRRCYGFLSASLHAPSWISFFYVGTVCLALNWLIGGMRSSEAQYDDVQAAAPAQDRPGTPHYSAPHLQTSPNITKGD
ncbi:histone methyltransferase set1 [Zalaria obscura]|uniref:Histone methyltransferase set1 n=1 Tax=Zalaria obscura TaxID=2024903 RepID=A0ACC3SFF3_9PEZI